MGDSYLRLIPSNPTWLPTAERSHRAARDLQALVPDADRVEVELHEKVMFIDQGVNFAHVACPACSSEMQLDWWSEQMTRAELSVLNPGRGWLTETELDDISAALGHPLRQVMAHY